MSKICCGDVVPEEAVLCGHRCVCKLAELDFGGTVKGIILAGGAGSRLHPLTRVISKQLLPVFDKPMIHYPLATLMLSGIREILIISSPASLPQFRELLGDGSRLGIDLSFKAQAQPRGIAEAVTIGEDLFESGEVVLILGDNFFFGKDFAGDVLNDFEPGSAQIFGYHVSDPRDYAVAEVDSGGVLVDLTEKPSNPRSNLAVPGLYILPSDAPTMAYELKPSKRGELEITDLNRMYLSQGRLKLRVLSRGTAWLDTGTFAGLHDAATFVRVVQERQGTRVACLEEIAFRMGFVNSDQLAVLAHDAPDDLGQYLLHAVVGYN